MKTVTRYQADDGSLWPTESEALARDRLIREVDALLLDLQLGPRPVHDGDFCTGESFVQQPKGSREKLRAWVRAHAAEATGPGPAARVAFRWACMDPLDREWVEPRFAQLVREVPHAR